MSAIATAIVGGAVIAGGASLIAGSEAAGATTGAANTAANEQMWALQQQEQLAAPYTQLGQSAIPTYQALLGIQPTASSSSPSGQPMQPATGYDPKLGPLGPGYPWLAPGVPNPNFGKGPAGVFNTATGQPTTASPGTFSGGRFTPTGNVPPAATTPAQQIQQTLQSLPGYQFTKDQGIQATEAQLSAMGLGKSGNVLTAVDQYTTGLADQNYQQYLGDIQGAVGLGQAAAAGQAANIGNAATNIGNIRLNQGNTTAGLDMNMAAAFSNAAGNAGNQYLTYQTVQNLTNPNYGAPAGWSTGGQTGDLTYAQQVAAGF